MATLLQLRRGTSAQHASFVGALAEITMDTVKKTLRVHDGVTPGGFPVLLEKDYSSVFTKKALTVPVAVPFAATMTVDSSLSNVFYLGALEANATLAIANPTDGQTINVRVEQHVSGNKTLALPGTAKVTGTIAPDAFRASWLILTYVGFKSRWEGSWSPVPL